jgi:hypothetical protein
MPRVSHPTLTAALAALPAAVLAMALAACGSGSPQAASPTRTVSQQPGPASDSTPTAASTPTSTQPISTQPTTALPGGTPSPGGRPPAGTGLSGRTVVVNCPVDRADPPCPGTPVPAHVVVLDRTGQTTLATVDAGADGRFTIALPAGSYVVRAVPAGGSGALRPTIRQITLPAGRYTTITLRLTNGLRG